MESKKPFQESEAPLIEEIREDKKAQEAIKTEETRAAVVRTVIILAMIIVLLLGMIITIRFVPRTVTSFSSFGSSIVNLFRGKEKITVTPSQQTIDSGSTLTVAIAHKNKKSGENGNYALSYPCTTGFHFELIGVTGGNQSLECDTLNVLTDPNQITLIPIAATEQFTNVPLTVAYIKEGETTPKVSGSTQLTIVNDQLSANPSDSGVIINPTGTTTATTTKPSTPVVTTPKPVATTTTPTITKPVSTLPDLTVRIIATGIIDPVTGQFVERAYVGNYERAAVKFEVKNIGGVHTGTWRFNASLPSSVTPNYDSAVQNSIGPQSGVIFTLGYTPNGNTNNIIRITVDPVNTLREESRSNNTASITVYNSNPGTAYGRPDLTIRVIAIGVLDRNTGQFIETRNISSYDKAAIKFEVSNVGDYASGNWQFTANLPTTGNQSFYQSGLMPSLQPGAKNVLTIGFDGMYQNNNNNTATINVDSNNQIYEINEGNNSATAYFPTIYYYNY